MRNLITTATLASVTLFVAAMLAAPGVAQVAENHETLETINEASGEHCPAVNQDISVSSGCLIHATSEGPVELRKHVFGIEIHITTCTTESWGRVNEDSEGYIFHQKFGGANCQRKPCNDDGVGPPNPWPGHGDEANSGVDGEGPPPVEGTESGTFAFCVAPLNGGSTETCEIQGPGQPVFASNHVGEGGHSAEIPAHGTGGFRCEIVGHGQTESGGRLENEVASQLETTAEARHIQSENKPEAP